MSVFEFLSQYSVVPVIAIDDAKDALPLADALIAGGLPIAEITFRTEAALAVIREIARHRPDVHIGAGTVLSEEQVDAAMEAGARFALSPGLDANVVAHAKRRGLPFAPGLMTPTDIQSALKLGCRLVKFFPAMAAGGPNMLKNIAGPYAHTGIGFNPTGGVNMDNLGEWLAIPEVKAVGGTWIASRRDIADGNWEKISANASDAVSRVKVLRTA